MRRRDFVSRTCAGLMSLSPAASWRFGSSAPWLLVPMDDAQTDHLKAYGLTYRALKRGVKAEWFLNYRSGAFLLPSDAGTARDAALAGVMVEPLDDARLVQIRGDLHVASAAEGWDPMQWREVANSLAKAMSWSAPLIPEHGDPSPYAGSAAAG